MTLDPTVAARLAQTGRRTEPTQDAPDVPPRPVPRTKPYRLTVDVPPALHAQFSRWIIDTEEQLGRNIDKRAVVLALLSQLLNDPHCAVEVRRSVNERRESEEG